MSKKRKNATKAPNKVVKQDVAADSSAGLTDAINELLAESLSENGNRAAKQENAIQPPDLDAIISEKPDVEISENIPFEDALAQVSALLEENGSLPAKGDGEAKKAGSEEAVNANPSAEAEELTPSADDFKDSEPENSQAGVNIGNPRFPSAEGTDMKDKAVAAFGATLAADAIAPADTEAAAPVVLTHEDNLLFHEDGNREPTEKKAEKAAAPIIDKPADPDKPSPVTAADLSEYDEYDEKEDNALNADSDGLFTRAVDPNKKCLSTPDVESKKIRDAVSDICDNLLILTSVNNYCTRLAISSPTRGDGKTTIALLTAMALSSSNRVLLADCDFVRPQLHKYFNCMNKKGIRNVLLGECTLKSVILNTDMPNLKFVTSGLGISAREIHAEELSECFKSIENDFDFIIFDTACITRTAYTARLTADCEGSVLVVKPGTTSYMSLEKAASKLSMAKANLLGVILNGK